VVVTPAVERVAQEAVVLVVELVAAQVPVVEQVAAQVPAVPVVVLRVEALRVVRPEQEQAAEVSPVAVVRFPSVRSSKVARPEVAWPERRLSSLWRHRPRK
jgi:hypothetical protein